MKETVGYEENVMLNSGQEALKTFAFSVSYSLIGLCRLFEKLNATQAVAVRIT